MANAPFTNAQILNTVRKYAPNDYQNRVPAVTEGNVKAALDALNAYTPDWNVFYDILLNKIGLSVVRQKSFTNPLKPFKMASLKYGNMIEEMQSNLVKAQTYDKTQTNVFEVQPVDIDVYFHKESRRDTYPITVPMADVIQGAFTEGQSLDALLHSLLAQPTNSDENDEFLLMLDLFRLYSEQVGYYNVKVPAVTDAASARELVKAVRAMNTKLRYYSTDYSAAGRDHGMNTLSTNTVLVIDADVDAVLTVDMLAYMFNAENGELVADRIVRVPRIPIDGVQALLVDESFLMVADTLGPLQADAPMNPRNLTKNYFLHHWQVMSYSLLANAVSFGTAPTTDLSYMTVTPTALAVADRDGNTSTTVAAGETVQIRAEVTPERASQAVVWSIETFNGKGKGYTLPASVFLDSVGNLHTDGASTGDTIVVHARCVTDVALNATYTVTIS